jgi:hypothetical protein
MPTLMEKMEAFRQAVAEVGDASAEMLSSLIEQKYGVTIEPRYIPFFRASLRDWEQLTRLRQKARAVADSPQAG